MIWTDTSPFHIDYCLFKHSFQSTFNGRRHSFDRKLQLFIIHRQRALWLVCTLSEEVGHAQFRLAPPTYMAVAYTASDLSEVVRYGSKSAEREREKKRGEERKEREKKRKQSVEKGKRERRARARGKDVLWV